MNRRERKFYRWNWIVEKFMYKLLLLVSYIIPMYGQPKSCYFSEQNWRSINTYAWWNIKTGWKTNNIITFSWCHSTHDHTILSHPFQKLLAFECTVLRGHQKEVDCHRWQNWLLLARIHTCDHGRQLHTHKTVLHTNQCRVLVYAEPRVLKNNVKCLPLSQFLVPTATLKKKWNSKIQVFAFLDAHSILICKKLYFSILNTDTSLTKRQQTVSKRILYKLNNTCDTLDVFVVHFPSNQ